MNKLKDQIRKIEKEEARLARKKKAISEKMKRATELDKKLDQIVKNSGFKNARELIKALSERFNVRMGAKGTAAGGSRRKRTRMTPELRDDIKKDLKAGTSMNATSKKFNISYAVVVKVKNGAYDKLK